MLTVGMKRTLGKKWLYISQTERYRINLVDVEQAQFGNAVTNTALFRVMRLHTHTNTSRRTFYYAKLYVDDKVEWLINHTTETVSFRIMKGADLINIIKSVVNIKFRDNIYMVNPEAEYKYNIEELYNSSNKTHTLILYLKDVREILKNNIEIRVPFEEYKYKQLKLALNYNKNSFTAVQSRTSKSRLSNSTYMFRSKGSFIIEHFNHFGLYFKDEVV